MDAAPHASKACPPTAKAAQQFPPIPYPTSTGSKAAGQPPKPKAAQESPQPPTKNQPRGWLEPPTARQTSTSPPIRTPASKAYPQTPKAARHFPPRPNSPAPSVKPVVNPGYRPGTPVFEYHRQPPVPQVSQRPAAVDTASSNHRPKRDRPILPSAAALRDARRQRLSTLRNPLLEDFVDRIVQVRSTRTYHQCSAVAKMHLSPAAIHALDAPRYRFDFLVAIEALLTPPCPMPEPTLPELNVNVDGGQNTPNR